MTSHNLHSTPEEPHAKLPISATEASRFRYEVASMFVSSAPPPFGSEAILSGSVARGVADEASDIEMVFYVDQLPSSAERAGWLQHIAAKDFTSGSKFVADEQLWMTFSFQNIWVEACWQVIAAHEKTLDALAAGELTTPGALRLGWIIQNAVSLRGGSLLREWQDKIAWYPVKIIQSIIPSEFHYQRFAYFLELQWALLHRGEHYALFESLYVEVFRLLRILFAINQQWEPDIKWLRREVPRLTHKPERLVERIEAIFTVTPLEQRIALYLLLLRDVLRLVPSEYEVTELLIQLQENLTAHNIKE